MLLTVKILNTLCSALLHHNKVDAIVCTTQIVGLDTELGRTNVHLLLILTNAQYLHQYHILFR